MKKSLALILALLLALSAPLALAEPLAGGEQAAAPAPANYEELVVGSTTAMSGNFFSDMFGSNTADMDVRTLLHGYNLIQWNGETGASGIDDADGTREEDADGPPEPPPASWFDETPDSGEETQ